MQEKISLIKELMNYLADDIYQIKNHDGYQSSIYAEDLLRLILRNIEGILCLASCDFRSISSALVISRVLLESFAKLIWVLEPDDTVIREIRFLAILQQEQEEIERYINSLRTFEKLDNSILELESDKQKIDEFKQYIHQVILAKIKDNQNKSVSSYYSDLLEDLQYSKNLKSSKKN